MKGFSKMAVIVVVMALLPTASMARANIDAITQFFIGFWEGVDRIDGSKRSLSISDHDGDGVLEIVSRDSFLILCNDEFGHLMGRARVGDDGKIRSEQTLTCFTTGAALPAQVTMVPIIKDNIIVETFDNQNLPPTVFHRVSPIRTGL